MLMTPYSKVLPKTPNGSGNRLWSVHVKRIKKSYFVFWYDPEISLNSPTGVSTWDFRSSSKPPPRYALLSYEHQQKTWKRSTSKHHRRLEMSEKIRERSFSGQTKAKWPQSRSCHTQEHLGLIICNINDLMQPHTRDLQCMGSKQM